jgi:hypothetical protein
MQVVLAQTCPKQGLMLHWDFNDDNGSVGGLQDGELFPKGVANCISATPLTSPKIGNSQPNPGNSGMSGCDTPDPGEQNELICTADWKSQTWQDPLNPSSDRYIKFSVTFPAGKAGQLSSFLYCVQSRDKTVNGGGSLNSPFNNNPLKYTGIAVYRNGVKVHEQIGMTVQKTWTTITANFSGASFQVDGNSSVTFDFYLQAYGYDLPVVPKETGSSDARRVAEWDYFRLYGCCGTVAPPCSLSSVNPTTQCYDNGTGQSSDDYYKLTINPSGTNTGSTYNYSISPGGINGSGTYGSPKTLTNKFAIGTNLTITITDGVDAGCTRTETVNSPSACSVLPPCSITALNASTQCNNNGTSSNAGDDYFTVSFNPSGTNTGMTYNYVINPGNITGSGTFGTPKNVINQFQIGTNLSITITDGNNSSCLLQNQPVNSPPHCSNDQACSIGALNGVSICNDNGTSSVPGDDYYTVTISPHSTGAGASYTYSINPTPQSGSATGSGTFGSPNTLSQRFAPNTNYPFTITSSSVPGCSGGGTVQTGGTCSSTQGCMISSLSLVVSCRDNNTPASPGDDYYTMMIYPFGSGLSGSYSYTISPAPASGSASGSGIFGQFNNLTQQFAPNSNYTVTVVAFSDPTCQKTESIPTGAACSSAQCTISSLGASTICNDNGTGTIKTDDYYSISLNPGSSGAGSNYTYSISPAPLTGAATGNGTFGSSITLTQRFAISTIYNITITSVTTPTCTFSGQVATGSHCSLVQPCQISNVNAIAYCIENGPSDYVQMVLNPTGTSLSSSYNYTIQPGNITGTGTFGVQQIINNLPLNTPFTVSVVSTADPLCSIDNYPVAAPPLCPPVACNMTFIYRTECRDNGTPYDGSDDFYRAFITTTCIGCDFGSFNGVASAQSGSGYNFSFPFSGTYGTEIELNYNIPKGVNLDVDIFDDTAGSVCKKENNIVNSPLCKPSCLLQQINASVECNNNGTLDNPSDDFYSLTINPTGLNIGITYTYLVMPGNITGSGAYGTPKKLNNRFPIGTNLTVSITDVTETTCQLLNVSVVSPPSCSPFPPCGVTSSGATTICNDNGSPLNASDDYYLLTLNPVGINLNPSYTYVVNPGNITGTGTTGTPLQLTNHFPIGSNVTVSITDGTIAQCVLTNESVTSPGVCSVQCDFTNPNVIRECKTDITGTQKFWRFSFNPSGTNLGNAYYYYVINRNQSPPDTLASGFENYGNAIQVSQYYPVTTVPSLWLVIADTLDASCTFPMQVFPGTECETCGYIPCSITNLEKEIVCNGANFTLQIQPQGTGTGFEYNYTINPGNITGLANYGIPLTISGSFPVGTIVSVNISDVQFPGCSYNTTIQGPLSCSCNITSIGATTQCYNNGTNLTTTDDYYLLTINPLGGTSNGSYSYVVNPGNITGQGTYGIPVTLPNQFPIGSHRTVSIYDEINATCTFLNQPVLSPGACSVPNITCDITSPFLQDQLCHDNNTPNNSLDDYISFLLNPSGTNVGSSYTISVSTGTISPTSGNFNQPTRFTLSNGSSSGGPITVVISDVSGGCQYEFLVTPTGPCSCSGSFNISGNPICDNRGTGLIADDRWFYQFAVAGTNLGTGFNYYIGSSPWQPGDAMPLSGTYGATITQPNNETNLIANVPVVYLSIKDISNPDCKIINYEIPAPLPCSTCDINDVVFTSICHDNNNSNPSDDYWSISLRVNGLGTSGSYNVSGDLTASGLVYGSTVELGNIPISTFDIIFTITDANNPLCQKVIKIERPGETCTECGIAFINPTMTCLDNGTPTNYTDDYFTVSIQPVGNYLGSTYQIIGDNFNYSGIPYGSPYQIPMNFPTIEGDFRILVRDEQNSGCMSLNKTLDAPVQIISLNKNILECQNCCTDANPGNDVLRVSINPVGNNINLVDPLLNQTMYIVDPGVGTVTPAFGFYGTNTIFEFRGFPSGPSSFNVTVRDSLYDEQCYFTESLEVPGCCEIVLPLITNLFCDNNNTPSKITDNKIRLTLLVSNSNIGLTNYNVTVNGTTISPTSGIYGIPTQFTLGPGSAGGGATFQITITDASGQGCNSAMVSIPDPGNCTNTTECSPVKCGSVIIQVNGN